MTRLSNRQFPMLEAFIDLKDGEYMTIEEAQKYDQRPFRSMLIQEWIVYKSGRGFHITKLGREAWKEFNSTEIWRKNPAMPLTSYFDATAYGLPGATKGRKWRVLKRGAA